MQQLNAQIHLESLRLITSIGLYESDKINIQDTTLSSMADDTTGSAYGAKATDNNTSTERTTQASTHTSQHPVLGCIDSLLITLPIQREL